MNRTAYRWIPVTLALALVAGAGCERSGSSQIFVEGAWARAMPLVAGEGEAPTNSAAYFLIRNDGREGDRLTGATSEMAEVVEIHESKLVNDMMVMEEQEFLEVPPGSSVELKPGGIHIMLLGIRKSLVAGEEFELLLHFEKAGDYAVVVPVRLNARN